MLKKLKSQSIKIQLLFWLLVPLCTLWLICAGVAYFLAVGFADDSHDYQLVNAADSVAARVKSDGTKVLIDLPPAAQAILRHSDRDKVYYQICTKDGTRISGDAQLPVPRHNLESTTPVLRNAVLNGKEVRMARIRVDVPNYPDQTVLIQVAETLNSRHELARHILLAVLIPQLVLIALGAVAVWYGVSQGLAPLKLLEQALARRSQFDLTPVVEADAPVEVKPLVHAINNLLERLADDIESQKRFVANAAHQFRTPLAALKTYIYCAKKLPSDRRMNEVLDKIDDGTERMSHLANKLLALAKAEPPNVIDRYEIIDLNDTVSAVTASFVALATKRELHLDFIGTGTPALVFGDPHNLQELAANLIENAIFYSKFGGHISVHVTNRNRVSLTISDDGPGIPSEERARVFERFYRVLGNEAPGSGLGLSIVKEIASAHNAEISIDQPSMGSGTEITVSFPRVVDTSTQISQNAAFAASTSRAAR